MFHHSSLRLKNEMFVWSCTVIKGLLQMMFVISSVHRFCDISYKNLYNLVIRKKYLIPRSFIPVARSCTQILSRHVIPLQVLSSSKALSTQVQPQEILQSANNVSDITEPESLNPIHHEDFFNVKNMVSIKDLFNARVHLGHREGSLNKQMLPYIFGSRMGHLVFDLDKTLPLLYQALNVTAHIAYRDGIILFIAQSPQNGFTIEKTAQECGEFAHTRVWRQGMFTNSRMIFGAVTRLPDLVIFLNTQTTVLEEHWGVTECAKMCIPTIGIVDSNCNPNLITYPIPGNDDTPLAINLYCQLFKEAILKGKARRKIVLNMSKES